MRFYDKLYKKEQGDKFMCIIKKIISAFISASLVVSSIPFFTVSAEAEEHILFEGSASAEFKQWGDDWNSAVSLGNDQFQVSSFTEPFTIQVEYESSADPILVMLSWTGGPSWVQMTPTYSSSGTAYFSYDLISSEYGTDFSLLNAINIMPSPSEDGLTVKKISYIYETDFDTKIELNYEGVSGYIINNINVGWNLGNTLDSNGDWITQYSSGQPKDFETAWGNPETTKQMIDSVKSVGFNAVRVPVTWNQHIDDNNGYKIDSEWMARVKEIVDYVIDNDMYCILNVHHDVGGESWLKASDENVFANTEKFIALWTQIANEFADYDSHLMFEGFNEILDENNNWTYPRKSAGDAVNKLNQIFVDTIRKTGENNTKRCLIVNTYAAGTSGSQLDDFVIPTDTTENALIVEVHYYSPASYCTEISEDNNEQSAWTENGGKSTIDGTLLNLYNHFTSKGVPVIIGEFGAANKDNESDRAEWAEYIIENAKKYGIKCFWWDGGGKIETDAEYGYYKGMALYDRYNDSWIFPEIIKSLTGVDVNVAVDVKGDVNADGKFTIIDVVIMKKWILNVSGATLPDWKSGDLCVDNIINVLDLCLMKKLLIEQ